MKKHQKVAIIVSVILMLVSFAPWILLVSAGVSVANQLATGAFSYLTFGVAVAAVIVFSAFFFDRDE